jgi:hypothetical protein
VGVDFLHQDVETLSVAELGSAIRQTNIDLAPKADADIPRNPGSEPAWNESQAAGAGSAAGEAASAEGEGVLSVAQFQQLANQ